MADIITSPVTVPTGIAVDTGGLFTPGAAFAIDASAQIINAAWNLGLDQKTDFEAKVTALAASLDALIAGTSLDITPETSDIATIVEPIVTIPASIDTSAILATFEAEALTQIATLVDKVQYVLTTWFPNDTAHYSAASTWMVDALNDDSGLPAAVRAQITSDDLARLSADKLRSQDAVIQRFAALRFPMPPGPAASIITQIEQTAQQAMAESSRKITIASIERLQWAAEKVLSLRTIAMGYALDYAKTMAAGQNVAASVTGIGYDAQTKLIGAVSSFYNARTDASKTITASKQFNSNLAQDAKVKNQIADLTLIEDRVKTLMAELQAIAQMATSLFNNVHASGGSSYSVNGT